ncbi:hypothetical protein OUZ56_005162 [Daphnia magna]|uniref:Uncharacterized protein n=1 Tax=Daphnia magna TaxID=35525 RepID=A0ABQ9YS23_9CRUS|nr:hypothetical protein OUZ56_005162 [Daphnia magna]
MKITISQQPQLLNTAWYKVQIKTMSFCAFCCNVLSGISNTGAYTIRVLNQSPLSSQRNTLPLSYHGCI